MTALSTTVEWRKWNEINTKPLTNYCVVTSKSPEELAEWLDGTFRAAEWCDITKFPNEDCAEVPCYGCILEWLKQEVTDGKT